MLCGDILHTCLVFTGQREGDRKGWYTVLVTALGSWEKTVPRGQCTMPSAMFSIENELQKVISHFAKSGVYLSVVVIDVLVYARRLTRFEIITRIPLQCYFCNATDMDVCKCFFK
jgi:hypothetical protein